MKTVSLIWCAIFLISSLWSLPPTKSLVRLTPAFEQSFRQPVDMQPFPMVYPRLGRLFAVVEKRGLVYLVSQNSGEKVVLLDEIEKTLSQGWEEGMLSLAFSPDFAKSGRMYIYSSRANPRRTVLSRYSTVLPSLTDKIISLRDLKLKWQEEVLLEIRQPFSNHNGGTILFGPDGMLYLGTGDGGSAGDPRGYAQNPASLLGKILRLKVDGPQGYEIPPDNPFVKKTNYRGEIFALGLRNPWRMSFSPEGELIVADVGQDLYEEVTIVKAGENHGWNIMEGFHCFQPKTNCPKEGLVMPILEYTHEEGQSILGGEVYTGKKIPFLHGKYVFGDSMSGKIWYTNLKEKNPQKKLLITLPGLLSSFGRDQDGELYVIEMTEGKIYRLEPN